MAARDRADDARHRVGVAAAVQRRARVVDVDALERGGEAVRVALAAHLAVGDDVEPGALLVGDRQPRRVVLGLLQVRRVDAPQLARAHARREAVAQPLAVDQPVRLRVGADEARGDRVHAGKPYQTGVTGVPIYTRRMPREGRVSARHTAGVAAEILLAVAIASVLVAALDTVAAIAGLGVVYLLAVLTLAIRRGRVPALAAAVLSVLVFNYFFLPPTDRLTITDGENVAALAVFLVAAVVTSSVADLARARAAEAEQRRREADLAAELARILLAAAGVEQALRRRGRAARRGARAAVRPRSSSGRARGRDGEPRRSRSRRRRARSARSSCPADVRAAAALGERVVPAAGGAAGRRARARPLRAPRWSRRRRCAAATSSRPRSCGPSRTTCARP